MQSGVAFALAFFGLQGARNVYVPASSLKQRCCLGFGPLVLGTLTHYPDFDLHAATLMDVKQFGETDDWCGVSAAFGGGSFSWILLGIW